MWSTDFTARNTGRSAAAEFRRKRIAEALAAGLEPLDIATSLNLALSTVLTVQRVILMGEPADKLAQDEDSVRERREAQILASQPQYVFLKQRDIDEARERAREGMSRQSMWRRGA